MQGWSYKLQGMELQEKEPQKDHAIQKICPEKNYN